MYILTLTVLMCADNIIVYKKKKNHTFGSNLEYLLVLKVLRRADLEQNAGMIHKSNP